MTTHQLPFISLPRKSTLDTDFSAPIKHTIAQVYGERPDTYAEEVGVLGRCRGDAVKGAGSDTTARDLLFKYFGQLELLELRFAETKISFTWNDAFTHRPTTQTSLAFEKASILHLLSSILSHLASTSPRSSPEGLKRAYSSLRQSAGLLNFINENFLHAPSTDLSREVVGFAGKVMILQAGETFLEKCVGEKKPGGLVSKMCQSLAIGYGGLVEDAKDFQGKGIIDRNWISVINIKHKYFGSLAQWYRAKVDMDKGEHGAGMVRYEVADKLAIEANKLAREFAYSYSPGPAAITWTATSETSGPQTTLPTDAGTALLEICKAHLATTTESKTTSRKDNDLIYHALPPSENSLPTIDPLPTPLATPITIQEIYAQPSVSTLIGPDIFRKLVPLEVHEKASIYSEEKAKLVRAEQERCDLSEGEVRTGLEDLGVRRALNRYKAILEEDEGESRSGGRGVPREVQSWADEVTDRERGGAVEEKIRGLEERKRRYEGDLGDVGRELEEESRECEKMRIKYGHLWTQPPSSSYNRQYRDDLKSHADSLQAASGSDRNISELWHSIRGDLDLLKAGSNYLERMYADADAGKSSGAGGGGMNLLDVEVAQEEMDEREREGVRGMMGELEERLDRLEKVRRERGEVLNDLKEKIQNDDVSNLLLLNRRAQGVEPTLFATELEKFRPYQNRISAAIGSQATVLEEMGLLIKQIEGGRGMREAKRRMGGAEKRRDELDRRLRAAFEGYGDVRSGLEKANHFYDSLGSLVDNLRRGVRSFVSTRNQERNRLMMDAENRSNPSSAPSPSPASHGPRDLASQLAGLSVSNEPPRPRPNPPMSSPPPPSQSPYQTYNPSASPPPNRPPQAQADPYDFSQWGKLPTSYSSQPQPQATSSQPAPQLPPPPKAPSYASYNTPSPSQHYAPPAAPSPYGQPASPYPPPPSASPQHYTQPSQSPYPPPPSHSQQYPSYLPPASQSGSAPSPYPPPPSQSQRSYPSYGAPPPPAPAGYPQYPARQAPPSGPPPPAQSPYGQYPQQPPPPSNPYGSYTQGGYRY